jgi:uncharacterized protein YraI
MKDASMKLNAPVRVRLVASATLALSVSAGLAVTASPAASAASERRACTIRFADHPGKITAFNFRTGPSVSHASLGYLYRGDKITLRCARGDWYFGTLSAHSKSGLTKDTSGWLNKKFLAQLAG